MGLSTLVDRTAREQELIEAVKRGDEDRVRGIVYEYEALANTTAEGIPIVLLALYHGHRDIAQALVDLGAEVDIFTAAALNNANRLAMALRGRRDAVNSHSPDGWTPLGLAAYFGAESSARLLLATGADLALRSTNPSGNTPLHAAVAGKRHRLVELLIEAGADINATDANGWTPLNLAAREGVTRTIDYLLAHGADPTITAANGQTPLQTAEKEGKTAAVDVLRRVMRDA